MPFADLGSVVLATFGSPAAISVTRYPNTGAFVNGVWNGGAPTVISLDAAVQPAGTRDVQQLPEAERKTEAIAVWTLVALVDGRSGQQADRIAWGGHSWKVMKTDDWVTQAGYARSVAVREGQG